MPANAEDGSSASVEELPGRPRRRRRGRLLQKRRNRVLTLILFIYLLVEVLVFVSLETLEMTRGIRYRPVQSELTSEQAKNLTAFIDSEGAVVVNSLQDNELGWIPTRNNAAGMRDPKKYDPAPAPGVVRIAAYGDSFTFGDDVAQQEAWPARLAALSPRLEVLNYGVPGYGPDQAYLRFQRHRRDYAPQIVFIGYMTENLARTVSVFRPFMFPNPAFYTKPRFRVENDELVLLKNPVATLEDHIRFADHDAEVLTQLGEYDYHYQAAYQSNAFDFLPSVRFVKIFRHVLHVKFVDPIFRFDGTYGSQSEAYQLTTRIIEEFHNDVLRDGALPIVLIFPENVDQHRSRQGKPRRYQALVDWLDEREYAAIDVLEAFIPLEEEYSVKELTVRNGHYNSFGNEIVARFLHQELDRRGLLDRDRIETAVLDKQTRLQNHSD